MATKTLVIDTTDREHFFLAVNGNALRVGDDPGRPAGSVRGLRVVRIRCEVEVEDDRTAMPVEMEDGSASRVLGPVGDVQLGHAHLTLLVPKPAAGDDTAAATAAATLTRRLLVIDGADQGRKFTLPATGTVTVGKAGRQVDVGLHDLYVARIHCSLEVSGDGITVTHLDGQNGTLIDGLRIGPPHALKPGSVLRVGNSHLRLEVGVFADDPPPPPAPAEEKPADSGSKIIRADSGSKIIRAMSAPARTADPLTELEGQTVGGHYELGPLIGRGFAGAVYRATNTKNGQQVAVKVLAAEFPASSAELERFGQELKPVHQVRHANILALIGAGLTGPLCWIAREYVEGDSAAAVVARVGEGEKPSWTRAARVAVHLARALDCLRQHRMIHGNITPRNVLLRAGDHATKLAELGLAWALEGSRLGQAARKKKLAAEMAYMAPEQVEAGAFVDDLADLYAVGAVAYSLIAGRPPVTGHTPAEMIDQIKHGRIVRPGTIYKKTPAPFDAIVMKLLSWRQEDRYQTAAALLADLEPIVQLHDVTV